MKIVKSNPYARAEDARYCLFVRTRWEPGRKESRQLQEYFIDTYCKDPNPYAHDLKRYKPEIVDYDKTKHKKKICDECVKIYKQRRALLRR